MRFAIANWDNRVSPVLDAAAALTVVDDGVGAAPVRRVVRLESIDVWGRAREIQGLGLQVLICGAVSRPLYDALTAGGVEVIPFVAGEVEAVLAAYRRGELPDRDLTLPGCRCHWRGRMCGGPGDGRARQDGRGPRAGAMAAPAGGMVARGSRASAAQPSSGGRAQGAIKMVVVSARGDTMDAAVDSRFGRAPFFIAVDAETGRFQAHSNQPNLQSVQGAGIQAAQLVASLGANVVISGNVGPKAFRVLRAAKIRAFRCDGGTVAEAVARFQAGELPENTEATVPGHWA